MSPRTARFVLVATIAALVAFGALNLQMRTDITRFLPSAEAVELGAISRLLTESELARTLVITVAGETPRSSVAAAAALARELEAHPAVREVRRGLDADLPRQVYELYFPRRHGLLSAEPEREIPELTGDEALAARAERLRAELSLPSSTLRKRVLPEDPLGAFERVLERFRSGAGALRPLDGGLVSEDGFAVLFVRTHEVPFNVSVQAPFLEDLSAAVARISEARGEPLRLERSGVSLFAVAAEEAVRGDVVAIASLSVLGVSALFLVAFGSIGAFGMAMLPGIVGILLAIDVALALRGEIDGLTLAFGTSLIGVAIDYPIHLLLHRGLAHGVDGVTTARRLRPSIGLGAATTMASFLGLGLTDFPGFREIALFSVVGIGGAVIVTLFLMPPLLGTRLVLPPRSAVLAERLGRAVGVLTRHPRALVALPLGALLVAATGMPRLQWNDDLQALTRFDPALRAEDTRVRERVARLESSRVVLALADSEQAALERNDAVYARLRPLLEDGSVEGIQSLHTLLWSEDLQRRNHAVLRSQPDLSDRVERAFTEAGFRAGAFAPFAAALESEPPPPPLARRDLLDSPLGELVEPLFFELGERRAAITYLRGGGDLESVRESMAGLPEVRVFEQRQFINEIYASFRGRTLRQIALGSLLVVAVLALRYRRVRPALAAFLPSVLTAATLLGGFAWFGIEVHLVHVVSLLMVMGMGVDYGIFLVDSADHRPSFEATLLSLAVACGTTSFVFGSLVVSSQEALRAMGMTTGLGVILSFVLAPAVFCVLSPSTEAGEAPSR